MCASCSPSQQKKRKQKVVGILWCLYNNIVVTSSVSNWKIVWSGNINLLVGEQINKIFKKIWTVLTYVKLHKIKMYNTTCFHVLFFIARNKKYGLERIYWNHLVQRCFQLILETNETNLVWIRAFPRSKEFHIFTGRWRLLLSGLSLSSIKTSSATLPFCAFSFWFRSHAVS
jgi:hypothetical protein